MNRPHSLPRMNRRGFLQLSGGLLAGAIASRWATDALLKPERVASAADVSAGPGRAAGQARVLAQSGPVNLHLVGTDGWIYLPETAVVPPYFPDDMAPPPFNTYIFGFRNVTSVSDDRSKVFGQKMKAQLTAPLFWLEQEQDFTLKLTNLGLQIRPDLIDAHTLHFHGFRNAIPIFDGEPHSSVGVPIARDLTYFYRPHDPGTYMYHCHFEETEHVHMGMVGPTFIRPLQDKTGVPLAGVPASRLGGDSASPVLGYTYNDGDGSTAFDREFVLVLSEIWTVSHWCDSHIQLPEWSDYKPEFYLINGRAYPDTLAPHGGGVDLTTGDLIPPPGRPELQYQPLSALVQANAGERVLLRIINLGFEHQAVRLGGIKMRVVGKDATLLRGRGGTDTSYLTDTVAIGPGETRDAIFVAPAHSGGAGHDTYLFYNRNYARLNNGGHAGYGGQMTEVRVFPAGTLPPQTAPNT